MSRVTRLSPLVRVVLAPNPSPMTLEGTNTYLVGEERPVVIDPGPDDEGHLTRVLDEAGEVSAVLITHRHHDHAESAERFAKTAGAPLYVPRGDDRFASARQIGDGQRAGQGDATLTAVATPGHSSDHVCYLLVEEGTLFTGDHILGRGTTVVAHPDGDMSDYMVSLERTAGVGARRLYPGHGPVVEDPAPLISYYMSHRIDRERQILGAMAGGAATVGEIVVAVYRDEIPAELHPAAALSVRAHLAKLRDEARVREDGDAWTLD